MTISIKVTPATQQLTVLQNDLVYRTYTISTAVRGLGEVKDSYKTPRGWHVIRAKIGANAPLNAIFKERRFYGDILTPEIFESKPNGNYILTRILWLSGLEPGFNRLGNVDTMQRYIYIHGTPDQRQIGVPSSLGCICMRNADLVELFDMVTPGTKVHIADIEADV